MSVSWCRKTCMHVAPTKRQVSKEHHLPKPPTHANAASVFVFLFLLSRAALLLKRCRKRGTWHGSTKWCCFVASFALWRSAIFVRPQAKKTVLAVRVDVDLRLHVCRLVGCNFLGPRSRTTCCSRLPVGVDTGYYMFGGSLGRCAVSCRGASRHRNGRLFMHMDNMYGCIYICSTRLRKAQKPDKSIPILPS